MNPAIKTPQARGFFVWGLEKAGERGYSKDMNELLRGMATIGDLSPSPVSLNEYSPRYSAWQWVANSFAQAGYNIWLAIKKESSKGIPPNCTAGRQVG
jgi:hypothetical protein